MEIIFGKKYPIARNKDTNELSWMSVEFEKDVTGKILYKLRATHPRGVRLTYLKGKDFLLSDNIQRSLIRNFEVKTEESEFAADQTVTFEVLLPYDFQTRYLPLSFEKTNGVQELVLRLRFGDYKFMLASRVLNNVSFVENTPVMAAQPLDQLFLKRSQLKKRALKEAPKEMVSNVNVDDIYNDMKGDDSNFKSRIATNVEEAMEVDSSEQVLDEFDLLVNKYGPKNGQANSVIAPSPRPSSYASSAKSINLGEESELSYEDMQKQKNRDISGLPKEQQDILINPTTEDDYDNYMNDFVEEKENTTFKPDASIDEIIAQAGSFDKSMVVSEDDVAGVVGDIVEKEASKKSKPKTQLFVEPVDTEELFGFAPDNWNEPNQAPVLVMKPKPINKKRGLASMKKPERSNFVEMVPSKKPSANPMDDLFGGSEANPSGFGF